MVVNDPVADMLARIRNAHLALHKDVRVPGSKVKADIARILQEEGYIEGYEQDGSELSLKLRYSDGNPLISGLKRISRPGLRVYTKAQEIPRVQNGIGICIISTSRGLMEGEAARRDNVGGELLCEIW
jgi:small subunit ribosomal protein S8